MLYRGDGLDNEYFNKRIQEIKRIPLREIIEEFGGSFTSNTKFTHPFFNEKTSSCFIYVKNGEEKWKCFGRAVGGDAIQFVSIVSGTDFKGAITKILGNDHSYKLLSDEEYKKYTNKLKEKEIEQAKKTSKKMYAILKNSVPALNCSAAVKYFEKRGILDVVKQLKDKSINILCNTYIDSNKNKQISIVYHFKGNKQKGISDFLITKGIDEEGNKNGVKINVSNSRPIIHMSKISEPIIVGEGIEDALSAVSNALGYNNFLSLNSTSAVNRLIVTMNSCRKWFLSNKFELALDNDRAGINATKTIKVFCNLADIYENKDKLKIFAKEIKKVSKDASKKEDCKRLVSLLKTIDKFEKLEADKLIEIVKLTDKIMEPDYFKDFGDLYAVTESDYMKMMKENNVNDINDLLVKYFKSSLKDVIDSLNEELPSNINETALMQERWCR